MPYNIKTYTLYAGLICFTLLFAIIAVIYVTCKIRREIIQKKTKYES